MKLNLGWIAIALPATANAMETFRNTSITLIKLARDPTYVRASANLDPPFQAGLASRGSRLSSHISGLVTMLATTVMSRIQTRDEEKWPRGADSSVIAEGCAVGTHDRYHYLVTYTMQREVRG